MGFASVKGAILALVLALSALGAETQPARPSRLALVIGNGAYKDSPLPNPTNDAADMARALEASGFTVIKRENAGLREMHLALREFGDRLGRQTTGLFYFAGHGVQVRGRNYLLPVDADIAREDEVAFAAIDVAAVMEKLDSAKNPVNIVVLDACRNNPFGARVAMMSKGLAPIDAPPGTFIAFATAPGSTAADGTGRNGLYTQHLVREIAKPGAPIEEVFKQVRAGVRKDSKSAQVPWESTSLEAAFFFREPVAEKPVVAASPPKAAVASAGPAPSPRRSISAGSPPSYVVGDRWSYKVTNLVDQSTRDGTMRVTAIKGDEVFWANGAIGDHFGNFSKVIRPSGRAETYQPSNYLYLFPMRPGASWDVSSVQQLDDKTFDLKIRLEVGPEEEVDTPAGKLKGVKVTRVVSWKQREKPNAGTNTYTYWYNAAVKRFVRGEIHNVTDKGKLLQHERQELVSYEVK
jgi:uncharacterized caspase-like protein